MVTMAITTTIATMATGTRHDRDRGGNNDRGNHDNGRGGHGNNENGSTSSQAGSISTDTLGLKDIKQFIQSGGLSDSPDMFRQLISLVVVSIAADLLHLLASVAGFGQTQNKPSGSTIDLTSDKQSTGYAQTDDTLKKALNNILKPHD